MVTSTALGPGAATGLADAGAAVGLIARSPHELELILCLATGGGDTLSGRHLSVHDDLDTILEPAREVRRGDLYVLRPHRLAAAI